MNYLKVFLLLQVVLANPIVDQLFTLETPQTFMDAIHSKEEHRLLVYDIPMFANAFTKDLGGRWIASQSDSNNNSVFYKIPDILSQFSQEILKI